MVASYPGTVRAFATHVNTTEVVDASHMNEVQDEITAVQTALGLNPRSSTAGAGSSLGAWSAAARTYATLSDRLANIEAGHLTDTHTQYVRFAGTETITGTKTFATHNTFFGVGAGTADGCVVLSSGTTGGFAAVAWREGATARWQLTRNQGEGPIRLRDMVNARDQVTFSPGASTAAATTAFASNVTVEGNTTHTGTLTQTGASTFTGLLTAASITMTGTLTLPSSGGTTAGASAVGDTAAAGTSTAVARADHRHAREAFGTAPPATLIGSGADPGTATTPARSDHRHGLLSGVPAVSTVGQSAAEGTSQLAARLDHVHGREAYATTISAQVVGAGTAGVAANTSRGDHVHSMAAAAPTASAVGDTSAEGGAGTVARSDHKHAREAFGTAITAVDGAAAAAGTAVTPSRSDHKHQVTVGAVVAQTSFNGAAGDGTSTALARADHTHGTPSAPTAASVGALPIGGGTLTGSLTIQPATAGSASLFLIDTTAAAPLPSKRLLSLSSELRFLNNAQAIMGRFTDAGAFSAATTVTGTTGVFDGTERVYSTNNPPPIAAPVVIMPFFVGGSVGVGLRAPEFIATVPMTVRGARSRSRVGSGTYQVYVNGASVSGAAAAFSTTQALHDFTDVNINAGDRVQINVASATSAEDLSVTIDVVTR